MNAYKMPFGKFKGTFINEVPRSYLTWLSKQDFVKGNLRMQVDSVLSGRNPPTAADTIDEVIEKTISRFDDVSNKNKENKTIENLNQERDMKSK